jgi:hypothetical protein
MLGIVGETICNLSHRDVVLLPGGKTTRAEAKPRISLPVVPACAGQLAMPSNLHLHADGINQRRVRRDDFANVDAVGTHLYRKSHFQSLR